MWGCVTVTDIISPFLPVKTRKLSPAKYLSLRLSPSKERLERRLSWSPAWPQCWACWGWRHSSLRSGSESCWDLAGPSSQGRPCPGGRHRERRRSRWTAAAWGWWHCWQNCSSSLGTKFWQLFWKLVVIMPWNVYFLVCCLRLYSEIFLSLI